MRLHKLRRPLVCRVASCPQHVNQAHSHFPGKTFHVFSSSPNTHSIPSNLRKATMIKTYQASNPRHPISKGPLQLQASSDVNSLSDRELEIFSFISRGL